MMYKLICILECLTLVATNPLQGIQTCPQVKYVHNYGQPDEPLIAPSNYKPYQQQLLVQNQITPAIQTIPYLHNDQISRLYYKVQPSPTVNSFADANTRVYDQNGIEITRYVAKPHVATPNVVNNYIIVPLEYFKLNESVPNEKYYPCNKKISKGDTKMKNNELSEIENPMNKKREHGSDKNTYIDDYTNNKPMSDKHSDDVPKKKAKRKEGSKGNKSKRKSSKKNKKKCQEKESLKVMDEDDVLLKPYKKRTHRSKLKALENENDKELEEHRECKTTSRNSDDSSKLTNQKIEKNKILKTGHEKSTDSQPIDELHDDIHINNNPSKVTKKTADVDVCFDINEECANLESRRIRNNCYDRRYNNNNNNHRQHNHNNNCQQNMQRDCPANIASYLNSIMSIPQLNTNYFNSMGNFPYNFNYLYQVPPQSNRRCNESNKKRKKGKKKQKSNNSNANENQCTNKNQDHEVTSDDGEKVVELTPQFIEIEQINEPLISEMTSTNIEKDKDKTVKDSVTKEFENEKTGIDAPADIIEIPPEIIDPTTKIVEPTPKIVEFTSKIVEHVPKIIEAPREITLPPPEIIEPPPEIFEPPRERIKPHNIYAIDDSEETLDVAPVLRKKYIPFLNDNDVVDEYYPDFTSDNIYLSKEDYEYNNFHDRYYYASDNKAEMSREKRRYEHVKGKKLKKSNDIHNNKQEVNNIKDKKSIQRHKDTLKNKENPSEIKFRVPPPLEFPDFKTEMVNKDRDNPRQENEHIHNEYKSEMSNLDHDNEVETVFAHSKVVKYGASPNTQETALFDFTQTNIGDDKIIFSRDGDTTVIIARSLGYPDY